MAVETNVLLYKNKISAIPPKDLAAVVVGLTNSADVTLTTDSDRTAAETAIEVLVDVAKIQNIRRRAPQQRGRPRWH